MNKFTEVLICIALMSYIFSCVKDQVYMYLAQKEHEKLRKESMKELQKIMDRHVESHKYDQD